MVLCLGLLLGSVVVGFLLVSAGRLLG